MPAKTLAHLAESDGRWSAAAAAELVRRFDARKAAIKSELTALGDHPWAGRYATWHIQDAGCSLILAPKSGFVFAQIRWAGTSLDYGDVEFVDTAHLRLTPVIDSSTTPSLPKTAVLVLWGTRQYLVPEADLMAFCNEINGYGDSNSWPFRAENEGDAKTPQGLPEVPENYRQYLLDEPIVAQVLRVTTISAQYPPEEYGIEGNCLRVRFELDVGVEQGVWAGMQFFLVDDPTFTLTELIVDQVQDNTCAGHTNMYVDRPEELADDYEIAPGVRCSTRAPNWE